MILSKSVKIRMNSKHISKYWKMGYKCGVNDIIEVDINVTK